jgi:hypothetical protein
LVISPTLIHIGIAILLVLLNNSLDDKKALKTEEKPWSVK